LQSRIDLVIAAKTGQGKTLTFGLPILDLLIKKINRFMEQHESGDEEEGEEEGAENSFQKKKPEVFTSV